MKRLKERFRVYQTIYNFEFGACECRFGIVKREALDFFRGHIPPTGHY